MRIVVTPEKCNKCQACVEACLENHSEARLIIPDNKKKQILICRQCKKPPCASACTYEAFRRDKKTGSLFIVSQDCQLCYACVRACPFNGIFISKKTKEVLICDLCDGAPACVKACNTGALELKT